VPIVTAATAWQSPHTGQLYILIFNEAIWMGDQMTHSLLNPNQLCHYGTRVQDDPTSPYPLSIVTEDNDFCMFDTEEEDGILRYTIVSTLIFEQLAYVGQKKCSIIHMIGTKEGYDCVRYTSMILHQIFKSSEMKMNRVYLTKSLDSS
jgi:hypothetical protein